MASSPVCLRLALHPATTSFRHNLGASSRLAEVVEDTDDHNRAIIARLQPGLHDDFLLSQSLVDADKGFGTYPMTWSELLRVNTGATFPAHPTMCDRAT